MVVFPRAEAVFISCSTASSTESPTAMFTLGLASDISCHSYEKEAASLQSYRWNLGPVIIKIGIPNYYLSEIGYRSGQYALMIRISTFGLTFCMVSNKHFQKYPLLFEILVVYIILFSERSIGTKTRKWVRYLWTWCRTAVPNHVPRDFETSTKSFRAITINLLYWHFQRVLTAVNFPVVIGTSNYFGFGFSIVIWKL